MKRRIYNIVACSFLFSCCVFSLSVDIPGARAEDARSASAYSGRDSFDPYTPIFTPADVKLRETADVHFTSLLIRDAVRYNLLYVKPGTQMNLGFFSGAGNLGGVVNLFDSINFKDMPNYTGCGQPKANGGPTNCAIWVKGVSDEEQFPQHFTMVKEHWFDRAYTPAGSNKVVIYGKPYDNINPLDPETARRIWGQFSQRYADMARVFFASTGKKVKVWALIYDAPNNGIFAQYEYPELQRLEREGAIEVHCATKLFADWRNPAEWTIGTQSSGCARAVARMLAGGRVQIYSNRNVW